MILRAISLEIELKRAMVILHNEPVNESNPVIGCVLCAPLGHYIESTSCVVVEKQEGGTFLSPL